MPQDPRIPFVEGDIIIVELRAALMNFTQLITAQAQDITNHLVAKIIQGYNLNLIWVHYGGWRSTDIHMGVTPGRE